MNIDGLILKKQDILRDIKIIEENLIENLYFIRNHTKPQELRTSSKNFSRCRMPQIGPKNLRILHNKVILNNLCKRRKNLNFQLYKLISLIYEIDDIIEIIESEDFSNTEYINILIREFNNEFNKEGSQEVII